MWLPMALGFVASGSLFSWGAWKSLWLLLPGTYQPAEQRGLASMVQATAVGAGLAILVTLLGAYRRRRASSR